MGGASEVTDGRDEGKWRVGGSYKGTSSREEDLKVRFWNLWGGSSECRAAVTASGRGSVYRDPPRMEVRLSPLPSLSNTGVSRAYQACIQGCIWDVLGMHSGVLGGYRGCFNTPAPRHPFTPSPTPSPF